MQFSNALVHCYQCESCHLSVADLKVKVKKKISDLKLHKADLLQLIISFISFLGFGSMPPGQQMLPQTVNQKPSPSHVQPTDFHQQNRTVYPKKL